ncbi:HAMP domain-containing sensor histidine kinase [Dyadobacter sp. CY347]|uniref:HAMP domain-containing sensor histidine kinase n=1 Tax=Dyadobacter sp. CY347 TaxID=2909336 RepID=UPI001F48BBA4|nr:HAMP domain-containing sensor histidine kinase [Dyadobacter sp. CY347]MCF2489168.1 HAMP domain-containing histidine kinase [Dyadobacter sp. CY347]
MKTPVSYPFYASLRFRFGLIFGFIFLCFLLATGFVLYTNVKSQFEKSFAARLKTQANLILQETEINPLTIPLPASGEYFRLIYDANNKNEPLFDNLPTSLKKNTKQADLRLWRTKELTRILETGGQIRILYVVSAEELVQDINRLKIILFIYFPISFFAALIAGYFLSGYLLRPIENIVNKANDISLQKQIILLEEPRVNDEIHKLTTSLNQMLTRIQKQAQYQNAFFASASHELRTPLSVMLTELQTLQNEQTTFAFKPVIDNQIAEVQRLSKLVNDFLLMSQLRSGMLVCNKSEVNLPEITMEVLERMTTKALLKHQNFKIEITPEDGQFVVNTDRSHLSTILINLIENAIKHSLSDTTIHIQIKDSDHENTVIIRNTSNSPVTDVSLLSHEFTKQDLSNDGFGLGLWIVSRLAETIGADFKIQFQKFEFVAKLSFNNNVRHPY